MILLVMCVLVASSLAQTGTQHIKCWTNWMDRDDPSGTGDWETVESLKVDYPNIMCPSPYTMEGATVDGVSLANAGNVFYANDHIIGLICRNADQKSRFCRDYKVRFVCYPPYCGIEKLCWTRWFDRDDPSGKADYEALDYLQRENPGQICANPVSIEARTVDTDIPATMTGQQFFRYSPTDGFACENTDKQYCLDYKVRFGCPCPWPQPPVVRPPAVKPRPVPGNPKYPIPQ